MRKFGIIILCSSIVCAAGYYLLSDDSKKLLMTELNSKLSKVGIKIFNPDDNHRVCPKTVVIKGVDVFSGDEVINWPQLRDEAETKFILIKATEGQDFVSDAYQAQRDNAIKHGLRYGSYHFFHPEDDPHLQAQLFLKTVAEFDRSQLPAVLDWEISGGVPVKQQIKNAQIWLDDVEKASGAKPIIYLSPGFFNDLGNPKQFKHYPLFIAHYDMDCPSIPKTWKKWTFWQYNLDATPGIPNKESDKDVFNGTEEALDDFIERSWQKTSVWHRYWNKVEAFFKNL